MENGLASGLAKGLAFPLDTRIIAFAFGCKTKKTVGYEVLLEIR
jgi:hypothetical protein